MVMKIVRGLALHRGHTQISKPLFRSSGGRLTRHPLCQTLSNVKVRYHATWGSSMHCIRWLWATIDWRVGYYAKYYSDTEAMFSIDGNAWTLLLTPGKLFVVRITPESPGEDGVDALSMVSKSIFSASLIFVESGNAVTFASYAVIKVSTCGCQWHLSRGAPLMA